MLCFVIKVSVPPPGAPTFIKLSILPIEFFSENDKTFFQKIFFVLLCCMKTAYSVLAILKSICENKASRYEVNHLIELSQSFAYSYIKYRYKNLNKVLMAEDLTLQELAIDSIAPLFERDESGLFIKLIKAFNEWEPKIESEDQATFFLNRVTAKSTEKYVSELLRQSDPFFFKNIGLNKLSH